MLTAAWIQTILTIVTLAFLALTLFFAVFRHFEKKLNGVSESVARIEEHLITLNGRTGNLEERQEKNDAERLAFYKEPPWTESLQRFKESILSEMDKKQQQTAQLFADSQT